MNTKMPTLLNVIRALLGVQTIYIGIAMGFLIYDILLHGDDYAAFPLSDQAAYFTNAGIRTLLILGPPILTMVFIAKRRYKLTITFMSLTFLFTAAFLQNFLVLLHLFMLLVLLLHKPSKMYLKQEAHVRQYSKRDLQV
ncbi:hypothetical protein [Paenibacillus xylanilyticus]|uniref:DUF4064 domain-containing protein n=1 Tax=Paenibacillus xylanilyticus TaxID=248903 RepID=A0A7Y6BZ75_9BACL|nr:hypothetical protein [Paenibacillus xylanilyticus]NUU77672.1 hypothetical protein [Paenibacillus xylanilyticus]